MRQLHGFPFQRFSARRTGTVKLTSWMIDVGASREMVSRVVKKLELRGLIEQNDGRIVLRESRSP